MMEHYTKNTQEATAWCPKCRRQTQHRVDGGRLGPCLEHQAPPLTKAQQARRQKTEKARRQLDLFPES